MRRRRPVLLNPPAPVRKPDPLFCHKQFRSLNLLESTLARNLASVESKALTRIPTPLKSTLTKNGGEGASPCGHLTLCVLQPFLRAFQLSRLFSYPCVLFHFTYVVSPLFAILTKTVGVWRYSSHFGSCPQRGDYAFSCNSQGHGTGRITVEGSGAASHPSPLAPYFMETEFHGN